MQPEDDKHSDLSFSKRERLCSRSLLEEMVQKKKNVYCHPYKCYYITKENSTEAACHQIAISVPKHNFKKAVSRNRIKRMIRECYRLNHRTLLSPSAYSLKILVVYINKEILPYEQLNKKMCQLLTTLNNLMQQQTTNENIQ